MSTHERPPFGENAVKRGKDMSHRHGAERHQEIEDALDGASPLPSRGEPTFEARLDEIDALVWTVFLDEPRTIFGPQWCAYSGSTLDSDWKQLVHVSDQNEASTLATVVARNGKASADVRLRNARGEYCWFFVKATLHEGPARWVAVAVDIDERKRAETSALERDRYAEALLRLSRKLERTDSREEVCHAAEACLIEVTPYKILWVYLFAGDGVHADLYFGHGLVESHEVSRLTIPGDRMLEEIASAPDIVVVDDARIDPRTDKTIVEQLQNRTIINVPMVLPGKRLGSLGTGTFGDEGVHPPSSGERGFLTALASHIAVALDRVSSVIDRRQAEERLAESEERHRQIFENAHESLFLAEVLDVDHIRLLAANPAFSRHTQLPMPESLGKTLQDVLPPSQAELIQSRYRRLLSSGESLREEVDLNLLQGRRTIDSTLIPVRDRSGAIYRVVGIFADITEKRSAEASLRRLNRALRTLSFGNEALVRASTESELLTQMCHVLVEHGRHSMAWVGLIQAGETKLLPRAWWGQEDGYLGLYSDVVSTGGADLITCKALSTGVPQTLHDIQSSPEGACRDGALARGYRSAAAIPLQDGADLLGALTLFSSDTEAFDDGEMELLVKLANDVAYGLRALRSRREQERSVIRLESAMEATIQALGSMVELRDPYTAGHQRRVAQLSAAIAKRLGLSDDRVRALYVAGSVHDVGKICVPAEILTRPGRLNKVEFEVVKAHVGAGFEILQPIEFDWPIAEMVHQHHERLDGTGYPRGLAGEEILLEARILTVADVVEAMTTHRPYRVALGLEAALAEVRAGQGTRYDPAVVAACAQVFREDNFTFV